MKKMVSKFWNVAMTFLKRSLGGNEILFLGFGFMKQGLISKD